MSAEILRGRTRRELEVLARRKKVSGIRAMSKDELIAVLRRRMSEPASRPGRETVRKPAVSKAGQGAAGNGSGRNGAATSPRSRTQRNGAANGHSADGHSANGHSGNGHSTNGHSANGHSANGHSANGHSNGTHRRRKHELSSRKVATSRSNGKVILHAARAGQDRLFATAVDAHWFDVRWSLTPGMLNRAEAFFGLDWRSARPAIRIYDVTSDDGAATARAWVRDEVVAGQTDRWFVRVSRPDRMWLFEIGLLGPKGRFFALAHGEPIGAPGPLSRIRRQSGNGRNGSSRRGTHADDLSPVSSLIPHLVRAAHRKTVNGDAEERTGTEVVQLTAELVVHGKADPGSELRLMKDRIPLSRDGNFSLRLPIENGRVVIPVEHVSSDGAEQRTVILAIERSTRVLETQLLDETAE